MTTILEHEGQRHMIQKKKRRRIGYGPMGTPGLGPPKLHQSAKRGTGRLGKAVGKALSGAAKANAAATTPKVSASRADLAVPSLNLAKAVGKKGRPAPALSASRSDAPAAKGLSPTPARQKRAKAVATRSRTKASGSDSRRLGHTSASSKRAQARRDSMG